MRCHALQGMKNLDTDSQDFQDLLHLNPLITAHSPTVPLNYWARNVTGTWPEETVRPELPLTASTWKV